jgi:hypothetical protein
MKVVGVLLCRVLLRVGGTTLSRWKKSIVNFIDWLYTCDWAAGREFHANEKHKNADGQQLGTWFGWSTV